MDDFYRIETDPRRNLMQFHFIGQWTKEVMAAFAQSAETAMAKMAAAGVKPGSYLTLVDAREQGVHPQDVAAEMQAMIGKHTHISRRVALILSGSVLQKMQVNRIAPNDHQSYFADKDEALKWLLTP